MKSNKPLISVIICNYNYGRYIAQAIESALAQTYPNIELIIIDDGSTDNSRQVIDKYVKKNPEIRFIKQTNHGLAFSRNIGLDAARGDYIVFLDSDDILSEEYVQSFYKTLYTKSVDIVYGDIEHIDSQSLPDGVEGIFPEFSLDELLVRNYINASAMVRKSAIGDLRFDGELRQLGLTHEDWDFWLGLALKGAKFAKNNQEKLLYRVHGGSMVNYGDLIKQGEQFVKVYEHLVKKYSQKYPKIFQDIWRKATRYYQIETYRTAQKAAQITDYNEAEIANLKNQIQALRNSTSYKFGQVLTAPKRWLKGNK
jgi:glycosyltransferase involved in cell wall biosynthesis